MIAADQARNICRAVEMLAERITERVNQTRARPESWLNDDMRARIIRTAAREVLVDYLLGNIGGEIACEPPSSQPQ